MAEWLRRSAAVGVDRLYSLRENARKSMTDRHRFTGVQYTAFPGTSTSTKDVEQKIKLERLYGIPPLCFFNPSDLLAGP